MFVSVKQRSLITWSSHYKEKGKTDLNLSRTLWPGVSLCQFGIWNPMQRIVFQAQFFISTLTLIRCHLPSAYPLSVSLFSAQHARTLLSLSLSQVDESILSDAGGDDRNGGHNQRPSSSSNSGQQPSYPWVQMALPGGGIVSVPLTPAVTSGDAASLTSPTSGGGGGGVIAAAGDGGGGGGSADVLSQHSGQHPPSLASNKDGVLTVNAGEPVTHFNLDQLLEIVQSFQLDTTLAGHDAVAAAAAAAAGAGGEVSDAALAMALSGEALKVREREECAACVCTYFCIHCSNHYFSLLVACMCSITVYSTRKSKNEMLM